MQLFSGDKNYLAMLAVPVILVAIMATVNDANATTMVSEEQDTVYTNTETATTKEKRRSSYTASSTTSALVLSEEKRQNQIRSAVEKGDYRLFLDTVRDTPFGEIMTQEAFEVLVEQYKLRKSGYQPTNPLLYTDI